LSIHFLAFILEPNYNELVYSTGGVSMYVEILVLSQLMHGSKHGYEIKKNINNYISDTFKINNNVLYPMFRKYVKEKLVIKEIQYQTDKPNKFVYTITEKGKEHFITMLKDFQNNISQNLEEFLVRVSFFKHITNEDKQKILNVRELYLQNAAEYFKRENNVSANIDGLPCKEDFIDCEMKKIEIELDMIDRLKRKYA